MFDTYAMPCLLRVSAEARAELYVFKSGNERRHSSIPNACSQELCAIIFHKVQRAVALRVCVPQVKVGVAC